MLRSFDFSYQVSCVNLSDLLSNQEYKDVCALITNAYSWGDTDLTLVKKESFLDYLSKREHRNPALISKLNLSIQQSSAEYINLL